MATSAVLPQEGGIITAERASGVTGTVIAIICLLISGALIATVADTPNLYAALALLGVAALTILVVAVRRRSASGAARTTLVTPEPIAPGEAAEEQQSPAVPLDEEILGFAREITRPASFDQLQALIAQTVPPLLAVDRAWVVARFGDRQRVILPPSMQPAPDRIDVFEAERSDWTTFPLLSSGSVVGVLGVEVTGRRLSDRAVTIVRAVAPILAHALVIADSMDRLRETSILDTLTGCATRQHGFERLAVELKRAARSGTQVAVMMVDLDHFKEINDRYGHNIGDAVLTAAGRTMLQTLRASDVRSRWGGEEFLIVLPETGLEPARQVAENLLRRLVETPVHTKAGTIRISASIGLTLARPGEDDLEALIGRADRALYKAKADGRGCVRIVLGDLRGAPIGGSAAPAPLPFRERRDPSRPDRRRVPGGGRRKTDLWPVVPGRESDADAPMPRTAGDRANRH